MAADAGARRESSRRAPAVASANDEPGRLGLRGFEALGDVLPVGDVPAGAIPLFMLDMWEHAFYLDYLNVKADYVKAVWNIANWENVAERLEAAKAQAAGLIVR